MGNRPTVIRQGVIESVFIRIVLLTVMCNVFKTSLLTFSFASFLSIPALAYGDSPNLDISGVNTYTQGTSSYEQLTSVSQFTDLEPTDWAYQALSNLVESYGCVAGYPEGTFKGNRSISRYEAAALLNACLENVTEITDEIRRLLREFKTELSILKGRVDGLEARVGELESTQFSTTTKLEGTSTFIFGAANYGDSKNKNLTDGTSFTYDLTLDLKTSFTGKDMLTTRLRTGNCAGSAFQGQTVNWLTLSSCFQQTTNTNTLTVNRLHYKFPLGDDFSASLGPVIRQDDMLGIWPSVYPSDPILGVFTYAGQIGAYNVTLGQGLGVNWSPGNFRVSLLYVSGNGNLSDPNNGGMFNENSASSTSVQLGYQGDNWAIAGIYSLAFNGSIMFSTPDAQYNFSNGDGYSNNWGIGGYWQPSESGWIPSISVGAGLNHFSQAYSLKKGDTTDTASWYAGLVWKDVFLEGNDFGFAIGQPTFVIREHNDTPDDSVYTMEAYYKFQATDNISITPAIFYINNPFGQQSKANGIESSLGAIIKTTFKF